MTQSSLGASTELIWHNPTTGQTVSWAMNGTTTTSSTVLLQLPNWKVTRTADLNGDGQQDLIWENSSTNQIVAWLMNGTQTLQSTVLLQNAGWKITHTADFNGDGKADLLFYNASTGQTVLWLMNGTTVLSSQILFTSAVWQVSLVADLNGDGKADLIWRNSQTGQTAAWLMNGTAVGANATLLELASWRVTQVGDLDGDGRDDLIWTNTSTGQTVVWLMNGLTASSSTLLFTHSTWRVSRVADLDGDGKQDLIWSNSATGEVAGWLMNGATVKSNAVLLGNANWQLANVVDLNGDGKQDLIWRNPTTNQTVGWVMNGLATAAQTTLLAIPGWEVVGSRATSSPPASAASLPATMAKQSILVFGKANSPVRLAAYDEAGTLLIYGDKDSGHELAAQFADGTRLIVKATASGPGVEGESLSYQGWSLQVLSRYADTSASKVRLQAPDGTTADIDIPPPPPSLARTEDHRRALAAGGATDICPQTRPGDEEWRDSEAENRYLQNARCRISTDPMLNHPSLRVLTDFVDYIAERGEAKIRGARKWATETLPAAARKVSDAVWSVQQRLEQALKPYATSAQPGETDDLLKNGGRYSKQELADGDANTQLDRLQADLKQFKSGQDVKGLNTLDASKIVAPSTAYTPTPVPEPVPAPVPAPMVVKSVSPPSTTVGQSTNFIVSGDNLGWMAVKLDDCSDMVWQGGTSAAKTYSCTPTAAGAKSGTVKDAAGKVLFNFSVNVATGPGPVVKDVKPLTAPYNKPTVYTITGTNFVEGMRFTLDGCSGDEIKSAATSNSRQFSCTSALSGKNAGEIKDKVDGKVLFSFSVDIVKDTLVCVNGKLDNSYLNAKYCYYPMPDGSKKIDGIYEEYNPSFGNALWTSIEYSNGVLNGHYKNYNSTYSTPPAISDDETYVNGNLVNWKMYSYRSSDGQGGISSETIYRPDENGKWTRYSIEKTIHYCNVSFGEKKNIGQPGYSYTYDAAGHSTYQQINSCY